MLAVHYPSGCGIKSHVCGLCEIRDEMAPFLNFQATEGLRYVVEDLS